MGLPPASRRPPFPGRPPLLLAQGVPSGPRTEDADTGCRRQHGYGGRGAEVPPCRDGTAAGRRRSYASPIRSRSPAPFSSASHGASPMGRRTRRSSGSVIRSGTSDALWSKMLAVPDILSISVVPALSLRHSAQCPGGIGTALADGQRGGWCRQRRLSSGPARGTQMPVTAGNTDTRDTMRGHRGGGAERLEPGPARSAVSPERDRLERGGTPLDGRQALVKRVSRCTWTRTPKDGRFGPMARRGCAEDTVEAVEA